MFLLELIQRLDERVLLWIAAHLRLEYFNPLVVFFTELGDNGMLFIGLCLVMLLSTKSRRAGLTGLCALVLGGLCTNVILKHLVGRERPYVVLESLVTLIRSSDPNSFPSGHTCAAFAACVVWFRLLPERWMRRGALVIAVLMGFSRLYVGVHFPSDVLAGAAIGSLCAWAALWLCRRLPDSEKLPMPTIE